MDRKNIVFTCLDTQKHIENVNKLSYSITYHINIESCRDFIQSNDHQAIFLISSSLDIDLLLSNIELFKQVHSIFIFSSPDDRYKLVHDENLNVIGFYHQFNSLVSSIDEEIAEYNKQFYQWIIFDQEQYEKRDLSKHGHDFIGFHLFHKLIHHLPRDENAKQQMIEFFQEKSLLNYEFILTYQSNDALDWYLNHALLQQLINQELKTFNINNLYRLRYFLGDLCESLRQERQMSTQYYQSNFIVYHFMKLTKNEFNDMRNNQGKLILMRGFLLTSDIPHEQSDDFIDTIFEIQCNIRELGNALILSRSNQTLFDINTTYQLESIVKCDQYWIIQLITVNNGQLITEKYINDTRRQMDNLSIPIIFGNFLYDRCQWQDSENYFKCLLNDLPNEDLAWIEYSIGQALFWKGEWTTARNYFDSSYQRMLRSNPIRFKDSSVILSGIGWILYTQGKYEEAFEYIQRALEIQQKYYSSNHPHIAVNFEIIGRIYDRKVQTDEALEYLHKALLIRKEYYNDFHIDITTNFMVIQSILLKQRKNSDAFECFNRVTNIFNYYSQSNSIYAAINILLSSDILCDEKKYDQSLNLIEKEIRITRRLRPSYHIDYSILMSQILSVKFNQEKYDECLESYQHLLATFRNWLSSDHLDIIWSLTTIGNAHLYGKHDWEQAHQHYQQALDILERSYPSYDGCKASVYNHIGTFFYEKRDYDQAYQYYQNALELQEKLYSSDHIN